MTTLSTTEWMKFQFIQQKTDLTTACSLIIRQSKAIKPDWTMNKNLKYHPIIANFNSFLSGIKNYRRRIKIKVTQLSRPELITAQISLISRWRCLEPWAWNNIHLQILCET